MPFTVQQLIESCPRPVTVLPDDPVSKALEDRSYCRRKWEQLEKNKLGCFAISNHLVGQAVCDRIDARHKSILPPYVWGDGKEEGVRSRAAEEMKNTARAAALLGVPRWGFLNVHPSLLPLYRGRSKPIPLPSWE
jgi:hypothetical protein